MTSPRDTIGQGEATIRFLQSVFSAYYSSAEIQLPDRFGRREWGFMFFGRDTMLRHLGFRRGDELRAFLRKEAPAHVYYSAAYYQRPEAQQMRDKGWLGADLIFDLDADHIEGAERMSYEEMLSVVKREIRRLVEEFICGDFGFGGEHVHIVFSGSRGYHVHVTDPSVLELGSRERREIVDFITGVGLDLDRVFSWEVVGGRGRGRFVKPVKRWTMPSAGEPGWRGRMARATIRLLDELEMLGEERAVERMTLLTRGRRRGLGPEGATRIYRELFSPGRGGVRGADRIRREGIIDIFSKHELALWFLEIIKEAAGVKLEKKREERVTGVRAGGETDEPVTSDVKRLIRLPTSLHGKTGFLVAPLSIDRLESFDPLRDAVVLPEDPVRVRVVKELRVRLRGEEFHIVPGETELPLFTAIFATGRGAAVPAPGS
ncbi:MAG: DNA primase catalytic subunit PriS [Thermoplasmata archaeon]